MLIVEDSKGKITVMHSEEDPVLLYDKNLQRIPLDEEHPEYVLKDGDIAIITFVEKYSSQLGLMHMRDGKLFEMPMEKYVKEIKGLMEYTDSLYEYELVVDGVPVFEDVFFETRQYAEEYMAEYAVPEGTVIRPVLKNEMQ